MAKKAKTQTKAKSRPAPTEPDFAVCSVKETAIVSVEHEYSRPFGKGAIVDLAEKIADDVYLGDLVRDGCFERVSAEEAARIVEKSERTKSEPAEPSEER